ncbi:hypothetical protein [Paenibacillus sp. sgz302251]|uniref:hypothetical protein n=1 Tax=Paenibacillus sp. sgz302251 TaxID=3414493 RepID=UPI003C7A0F15
MFGTFIKNYLPTYMNEKGKNLATKEDIGDITQKTEEVKNVFQKQFADFYAELKFKNDFYYKQYSQLYAKLYAIVAQSEYFRYFAGKYQGLISPMSEVPFFEITGKRMEMSADLFSGAILSQKTEEIADSVTEFNKNQICDFIIANGDVASQKLLKLAVAYRFAHRNYSGSGKSLEDEKLKKAFDDEEFELIKKIIHTVIIDYNALRRDIKLDYSLSELETGLFDDQIFKSK